MWLACESETCGGFARVTPTTAYGRVDSTAVATVWAWTSYVAIPFVVQPVRRATRGCDRASWSQGSFLRVLSLPASTSAACGCVPHGQWAPLDADTPALIDRSARLEEPCVADRVFLLLLPVLVLAASSTSGAKSTVAARECPSRGLVEGLVARLSCSLQAALSLSSLHRDCIEHSLARGSFAALCSPRLL